MAGFNDTADANGVEISYIEEIEPGVTPAGKFKKLRISGESLKASISSTTSPEIRSDRNMGKPITTGRTAGGGISFPLMAQEYDPFFESGFQSAFGEDGVMKNSDVRKSFTIQKRFLKTGRIHIYRGCEVNQIAIDIPADAVVTGEFTFVAMSFEEVVVPLDASPLAPTANDPYDTGHHVTRLKVDDVVYEDAIESWSFTYNNNARQLSEVGTIEKRTGMGAFQATMNLSAYYGKSTQVTELEQLDIPAKISFSMTLAGKTLEFIHPATKVTDLEAFAGAINTDVMLTTALVPGYDELTGATAILKRTYA